MNDTLSQILFEALKPVDLSSLTTYCGELALCLPRETENFTRTEIHYNAYGLEAIYHCKIDDRDYTVTIKASKP
jgi:hypothetical protein